MEPAVEADVAAGRVALRVDESVYDLDVVMGAAYLFVDRCWVFLDRPADRQVQVVLRTREPATRTGLDTLVGEFANELLNQALRKRVSESNAKLREFILAKALFATDGPSVVDKLLAELDAEEMADDALDIPIPWEKPGNG
jgi:His-Xaa-Ser system protein HxsD